MRASPDTKNARQAWRENIPGATGFRPALVVLARHHALPMRPKAAERALDVWSQALMVHSYRTIRRMRYGTSFTRLRHHDGGNPSSNTK
jgi:hypothetical protein